MKAITEFLEHMTRDIDNLADKDFLLSAMKSHVRYAFPEHREKSDKMVDDWFRNRNR